jgi:hypothetical protein
VTRSLVDQHVGPVKTEASRKLMPIDEYVAHDLLAWYEVTPYKKPSDYVWATDANRAGAKRRKQPVWLSADRSRDTGVPGAPRTDPDGRSLAHPVLLSDVQVVSQRKRISMTHLPQDHAGETAAS